MARLDPRRLLLLAAVAAGLSGCGVRGGLEPPGQPGAPAVEPGFDPSEIFRPDEERPDVPPPNRPFILDPLV